MAENQGSPNIKKNGGNGNGYRPVHPAVTDEVVFGYPRDFLQNQFVYLVISPRARGLSIGVNVNPIVKCNFQCMYCEIDRFKPARASHFSVDGMAAELRETLDVAYQGRVRQWPRYANLPEELLRVRHVALSGDGEPTLAGDFIETVRAVIHIRALGKVPFFKIVLVTNSTALDRPEVQEGLKLLAPKDEIWAKLDGGTQAYLNHVNGPGASLQKILSNILMVARKRPVVIQSLFPAIDGAAPSEDEIQQYALRLKELKEAGADISLVQIYSATRPMAGIGCNHLPLKTLSAIAQNVRRVAALRAEVF
ncbi:MAG TPA: radical SAM protein [Verrucomicrobiae bacterium]|nr:radical SAM protein [Verrucomicrobiae bacterium]